MTWLLLSLPLIPFVALALSNHSLGRLLHVHRQRATNVVGLGESTLGVTPDVPFVDSRVDQFPLSAPFFFAISGSPS
jgi:hypothetical protein